MISGITLQAMRRHRWTLAGPFVTQALAAATLSAMLLTMRAIDNAPPSPAVRDGASVAAVRDATETFTGVTVYLSLVVVGVTMALAMSGQLRDIALLRTVGATPGQVRRSAARQAAVTAFPASLAGYLLGMPAGAAWTALLHHGGLLPGQVAFRPALSALPVTLAVVVGTSVAGTLVAAARTSRLRPGAATAEVATGRRRIGRTRTVVGLGLVAGAVVLSLVLGLLAPGQAVDAGVVVMLAQCVGVGLLAPHLLRAVERLSPVAGNGLLRVALDDVAATSRALSAALVPLVLAAAFGLIKIAAHTTAQAVTGAVASREELWTDLSGTAIYCAFAGAAAVNCLVTMLVTRRHDLATLQLAGATRRDVVRIVAIEAVVVAGVGLVAALGIATVTLAPLLHVTLGVWLPRVPFGVAAAGVAVVLLTVGAGMTLPAGALTRQSPTQRALAA